MKDQPTTISPYAVTPDLEAAHAAVEAARDKCKKLVEQVDATAAQVTILEADVHRLSAERAAAEGALALCENEDAKRHEKAVDRLTAELDAKERELRRARAKIEALEGMAPELDEQVVAKGAELTVELGIWTMGAVAALSAEVVEAAKPLAAVMAKARAIGGRELIDFLGASYVPAPDAFMRIMTSGGWHNQGVNLLDGAAGQSTADADAIAAQVGPTRQAASATQFHRPYVPLVRRPRPYVLKGAAGPGGQPLPPMKGPSPVPQGSALHGQKKPYQMQNREHAAGAQELDLGPALVENFDRPFSQEQL